MRADIVPGAVFPDYELSDHRGDAPHALGVAGSRSAGAGALPRRLLSKRREATRRAPATPSRNAGGVLPPRDHLDRQPARDERVPLRRRRPLDVSLGPRAQAAEGSRHRGIHRPGSQSDDPSHAGARARPACLQDLQRLLVLRPADGGGAAPRPARRAASAAVPIGTSAARSSEPPGRRATRRVSIRTEKRRRRSWPSRTDPGSGFGDLLTDSSARPSARHTPSHRRRQTGCSPRSASRRGRSGREPSRCERSAGRIRPSSPRFPCASSRR